jgi:hypothetical protein
LTVSERKERKEHKNTCLFLTGYLVYALSAETWARSIISDAGAGDGVAMRSIDAASELMKGTITPFVPERRKGEMTT